MKDFYNSLSIIIPTYQPEEYLKECIDSINNQIDGDLFIKEILIVLNGQKDFYIERIMSYSENNKKIKILYSERAGVSSARNLGLKESKGEYILFIDDDDFISQDFIRGLYAKCKTLNQKYYSIIVSDFRNYNDLTGEISKDYVSFAYEKCQNEEHFNLLKFRGFLSSVCGKLFPIEMLKGINFNSKVSISEDGLFLFQISGRIGSIELANSNVIYYRRLRAGSAIRKKRSVYFKIRLWFSSIVNYSKVYLFSPLNISFLFYLTRLMAVTKVFIKSLF